MGSTVVTINSLPSSTGRVPSSLHMTLMPAHAAKLDQIRLGLIADSESLAAASDTLSTNEDAIRFLIETATI